uniref:Uncharacterized protein n=1 Tax=Setaria viridis TaxID=4556 RepID=A0A4U6UP67_SETVI|nr:hypothetical protein SEVIR_5G321650v2 [Setaria viridis]
MLSRAPPNGNGGWGWLVARWNDDGHDRFLPRRRRGRMIRVRPASAHRSARSAGRSTVVARRQLATGRPVVVRVDQRGSRRPPGERLADQRQVQHVVVGGGGGGGGSWSPCGRPA